MDTSETHQPDTPTFELHGWLRGTFLESDIAKHLVRAPEPIPADSIRLFTTDGEGNSHVLQIMKLDDAIGRPEFESVTDEDGFDVPFRPNFIFYRTHEDNFVDVYGLDEYLFRPIERIIIESDNPDPSVIDGELLHGIPAEDVLSLYELRAEIISGEIQSSPSVD